VELLSENKGPVLCGVAHLKSQHLGDGRRRIMSLRPARALDNKTLSQANKKNRFYGNFLIVRLGENSKF
jgi:hypothetical protein